MTDEGNAALGGTVRTTTATWAGGTRQLTIARSSGRHDDLIGANRANGGGWRDDDDHGGGQRQHRRRGMGADLKGGGEPRSSSCSGTGCWDDDGDRNDDFFGEE